MISKWMGCGLFTLLLAAGICPAQNLSLKLDGRGSHVLLPPNLCTNLTEATVEVWAKWESFGGYSRVFEFGAPWHSVSLFNHAESPDLRFNVYPQFAGNSPELRHHIRAAGVLRRHEWVHIAAVSGPGGMLLYVNGKLVGQHPNTASFAALRTTPTNAFGLSLAGNPTDRDFHGELDEVRIWNHRRNDTQIRENMFKRLSGQEPGLEHLWNFDDGAVTDSGRRGAHGQLVGNARIIPTDLGLVKETPAIVAAPTTATPGAAAPSEAAAPNMVGWWVAGSLSALVLVLLWLALLLRRHAATANKLALINAGSRPPALSDVAAADGVKKQALEELANFAKESLVQGLYSQRAALLEANQQACEEMARLEARLRTLQLPERIQAYEQRIAELERDLATRDGALREMTQATLHLLRQKVVDEKKREAATSRFN